MTFHEKKRNGVMPLFVIIVMNTVSNNLTSTTFISTELAVQTIK